MNINKKIKYQVTILITLISTYAFSNPPLKMDEIKSVGRLTFFQSNDEFSYYLPSAFRSELECIPQGSKQNRCILRIFNDLNSNEMTLLSDLGPSIAISDLSYNIVNSISENLTLNSDLPIKASHKTIYTKTLRLSEAPYVLSSFIIDNSNMDLLLNSYKNSKIGTFKVNIDLNANETSYYLAIKDGLEFKSRLLKLKDKKIITSEISSTIENILMGLAIDSKGDPDPINRISEIVRLKYFQKLGSSKLKLKEYEANKITDTKIVLLDDTTENNPYLCEVSLDINESSVPMTICKRKGN